LSLDGVLVVDKPPARTSFAVVHEVRRLTGATKAGHAGTLDPMATGVLAVCLGEATKAAAFLLADEKEYEAEVVLGARTDSDDAEGAVVETRPLPAALDEARVAAALAAFLGPQRQRPPQISAVHVQGRRAYQRARAGEEVDLAERDVVVHALELRAFAPPRLRLRVHASKGFYVRALARDLGAALGTVAHLGVLRRTRSGAFAIAQALPLEEIARRCAAGAPLPLVSCAEALAGLPLVALDRAAAVAVRTGRPPRAADLRAQAPAVPAGAADARLVDPDGRLVAVVALPPAAAGASAAGAAADELATIRRVFFANVR
jgi:tRNA pseudouridine55 synthase